MHNAGGFVAAACVENVLEQGRETSMILSAVFTNRCKDFPSDTVQFP